MAYSRLYTAIGFEDRPSRKSPMSAANLNKIEQGIVGLDERIVEMSVREDDLEERLETVENTFGLKSDVTLNRQTLGYTKKNLLKINSKSGTSNGITYDSDTDTGIITLNGTATNMVYLNFNSEIHLKAGTYILNGCPAGGNVDGTSHYRHTLGGVYSDGTTYGDLNDYGEGRKFTITQEQVDNGLYFKHNMVVWTGYTAENLTFYPMLRSADITDDTYEPYVDDVDTRLKALKPVANLVTTVAGKPLDAVIGKELADMIAAIPTITFATEEPDSVPENTIVMVYEE